MVNGAVVVTGASTGIGAATVAKLAELRFQVFAGVRKEADAGKARAQGLTPLTIDVTDSATIAAAAEQVSDAVGAAGLAGLVNNAGVAVSGPLEYLPLDRLREQLEINLVGQVAVTQAFLPMLRAAHGRIVNVSSIGGRIALPLVGPYAASKFGLEAISDSLRRELRDHGVDVVLVEPGGVKTPIWEKGTAIADEIEAEMPPEALEHYGRLVEVLRRESQSIATETGVEPSEVADVIATALTARRPRTRYLVGRDAKLRWAVAKRVPDRWFDAILARALR
jgi:NAD(P)-dependent dehydrogenase (short-subunit alcohol dehydrogenase family)